MSLKKWGEYIAVALVLLGTIGICLLVFSYEKILDKKRNAIYLEARAVSTWSKTELRVKKGETARIRIRNVDNVSHGFAIPELDVDERIIRAGQVEIVEFVPRYAGSFVFKCVVQCSRDKHDFMTGKIIVTD